MKRIISLSFISLLTLGLSGCQSDAQSGATKNKVISVETYDENRNLIDVVVPIDATRIVALDYVAVDMLDSWGLGDRIVGMSKFGVPAYLAEYTNSEEIENLGCLSEINMEALNALKPDLIFSSARSIERYDEFRKIAPTINNTLDYSNSFLTSFETMVMRNASLFGKEEVAQNQLASFSERLANLEDASKGQSAILALTTGGGVNTLGNKSRGNLITTDLGFTNIAGEVDAVHGNVASFELLLEKDADYIFVIDRDSALNATGAKSAEQLFDNELIHQTKAYQHDQIVYLDPAVWYFAEGGISAMDYMLEDLEAGILK